jgi:hypothetical protein
MAYDAGAELMDMEFTQFHPTGMVWPPSVRGILVTEGVRGDGGSCCSTARASASCSTTSPSASRRDRRHASRRPPLARPATGARRRPSCSPATWSPGRSGPRSRPAAARPHGGGLPRHRLAPPADFIRRKLPSMYHQFKELAEVDITAEPMEVGPTLHYFMGGIRVDADTQQTRVPGLFACGECAAGHARRQPPRRQLALRPHRVRQARRRRAPDYITACRARPAPRTSRSRRWFRRATDILNRESGENPYLLHEELQDDHGEYVGIVRTGSRARRESRSSGSSRSSPRTSRPTAPASTTPAGTRRSRCSRWHAGLRGRGPRRADAHGEPRALTPASTTRASATSGSQYNIVRKGADGEMEVEKVSVPASRPSTQGDRLREDRGSRAGKVGRRRKAILRRRNRGA